jgi:aminopeptidase-like protein
MSSVDSQIEAGLTTGQKIHQLIVELYPFFRSITGAGVRSTLNVIRKHVPVEIHEVPTGTKVFDWEVPREWNIRGAYIKDSEGNTIVDLNDSNLHVVNYSIPVNLRLSLEQLKSHLYYLPEYPDWIPYRTSYYKDDWGFCLTYNQFKSLKDDVYEVVIDSTLEQGSLTYGEAFIPGEMDDEVLVSTHVCHPSLCNDNLSGIAVSTFLIKELMQRKHRYSYRFLFIPATIGSITWLALNKDRTHKIKHGLVATLLGDPGPFHYKKSRRGDAEIDAVVEYVLKHHDSRNEILEYFPYGYDERQYCSPGFNLPVGRLTRALYAEFPEYHTSGDNLDFVKPEALNESLEIYLRVFETLEANKTYINLNPYCEPQLGRRGIYNLTGGSVQGKDYQIGLLWVLSLADGSNTLLDIAKRSNLDFATIRLAAEKLVEVKLLDEKDDR